MKTNHAHWLGAFACATLLAVGCATTTGFQAKDRVESYTCDYRTRGPGKDTLSLPLLLEAPPGSAQKIYRHPVVGVYIESLEADGHLITPQLLYVDWYDFDSRCVQVMSRFHVYQLVAGGMKYGPDAAPDAETPEYALLNVSRIVPGDYDVVAYRIPKDVNQITIRYRPRYPGSGLGPVVTAIATYNDSSPN